MIQNSVKTSLFGLIGWRQSTVSGMPTVDAANLASSSGMMFQDFSSLVTVQNVYLCQEDSAISEANFNTFLSNLVKSSTLKVLNAVFSQPDFIENKLLYSGENDWINTLVNDTSFVGFKFNLPNRKDLVWSLNQVFTAFDAAGTVTLYLFHSSRKSPIQTKVITVSEDTETATELNWVLSPNDYAGGRFYIGYLRDGLVPKAINREFENANVNSCYKTIKLDPIKVTGHNTATLFDVNDVENTDETYGLNFDITAMKDFSNVVVQNKNRFVNAIGYQVAADVLDLILKTVRSNRIESITEGQVLYEVEGLIAPELPRSLGLLKKLSNEIADLKATFVNEPQLTRGTID